MQMNIDKLRSRYPEKFSTERAINRDLEQEREVMKIRMDSACER